MRNELNEQMRAEFEAWYMEHNPGFEPWLLEYQPLIKAYRQSETDTAWCVWQAAWNRRQHGSAAQAWVEVVNNQRDEDGNYVNAHVRTLGPFDLEHIPHGTKLYTAPVVAADVDGIEADLEEWGLLNMSRLDLESEVRRLRALSRLNGEKK